MERATLAANSLRAELVVTRVRGKQRERLFGTARLTRPNLAKVELRGKVGQIIAANEKGVLVYNATTNQFARRSHKPSARDVATAFGPLIPLAMFFDPKIVTAETPRGTTIKLKTPEARNGIRFEIVSLAAPGMEIRLYVGPDRLVHRSVTTVKRKGETSSIEVELTRLKLGERYPQAAFAYTPPKSAREIPGVIQVELGPPSGKQNSGKR